MNIKKRKVRPSQGDPDAASSEPVGSKGRKPESEQLKSCSPSLMGFLLWEGMVQTVGKRLKETLGISLENGHLFQGKGSRGLRENAWEKKEEEREKREKR